MSSISRHIILLHLPFSNPKDLSTTWRVSESFVLYDDWLSVKCPLSLKGVRSHLKENTKQHCVLINIDCGYFLTIGFPSDWFNLTHETDTKRKTKQRQQNKYIIVFYRLSKLTLTLFVKLIHSYFYFIWEKIYALWSCTNKSLSMETCNDEPIDVLQKWCRSQLLPLQGLGRIAKKVWVTIQQCVCF